MSSSRFVVRFTALLLAAAASLQMEACCSSSVTELDPEGLGAEGASVSSGARSHGANVDPRLDVRLQLMLSRAQIDPELEHDGNVRLLIRGTEDREALEAIGVTVTTEAGPIKTATAP